MNSRPEKIWFQLLIKTVSAKNLKQDFFSKKINTYTHTRTHQKQKKNNDHLKQF